MGFILGVPWYILGSFDIYRFIIRHLTICCSSVESETPISTKDDIWLSLYFDARSCHYCDVIMGPMACQITRLSGVYSTDCSVGGQSKHQSSASLAFVRGIHRGPVNSPHKWPVTRKMFPFDDVIMPESYIDIPILDCLFHNCCMETTHRIHCVRFRNTLWKLFRLICLNRKR